MSAAPGSLRLPMQRSGSFKRVASNAHGAVEVECEIVYAFEPPTVRFVEIGEPGGLSGCLTGLDTDALADATGLRDSFSRVDSMTAFGVDPNPSADLGAMLYETAGDTTADWSRSSADGASASGFRPPRSPRDCAYLPTAAHNSGSSMYPASQPCCV